MKRQLRLAILLMVILLSASVPGFALNKEEHNLFLRKVLFVMKGNRPLLSEEGKTALAALENASYLAIDQYNGNGAKELQCLRNYGVPGLPKSIDSFDFSANQHHRSYTHRGWDYVYAPDRANWSVRKNILLATTEQVFDFSFLSGSVLGYNFGYSEKCNSFAALVYYVHILGDHESRESYRATDVMMPLAQTHAGGNNPDILSELAHHLEIIFADQKETHKYVNLMQGLNALAGEARSLAATDGGVNTDEKFLVFHQQVEELLTLLQDYIPNMLKDEVFFTKVFY